MHLVPIADATTPLSLLPPIPTRTETPVRYRFAGVWRCALRLVDGSGAVRVATAVIDARDEGGTLVGRALGGVGNEGLDGSVRGCRLDDEVVVCVSDALGRSVWVLEGRWTGGRVSGRATRACRAAVGFPRAEGVFELERVS